MEKGGHPRYSLEEAVNGEDLLPENSTQCLCKNLKQILKTIGMDAREPCGILFTPDNRYLPKEQQTKLYDPSTRFYEGLDPDNGIFSWNKIFVPEKNYCEETALHTCYLKNNIFIVLHEVKLNDPKKSAEEGRDEQPRGAYFIQSFDKEGNNFTPISQVAQSYDSWDKKIRAQGFSAFVFKHVHHNLAYGFKEDSPLFETALT